jgi:hypothetical protein
MQGAQKLRSEAHLSRVSRDNDEVEAQSRSERDRWTFYETINPYKLKLWERREKDESGYEEDYGGNFHK